MMNICGVATWRAAGTRLSQTTLSLVGLKEVKQEGARLVTGSSLRRVYQSNSAFDVIHRIIVERKSLDMLSKIRKPFQLVYRTKGYILQGNISDMKT